MRKIRVFRLPNGREPFTEWRDNLSTVSKVAVTRLILRIAEGGGERNVKSIGGGVLEMRIHFGPGLRVYYGEERDQMILLLLGGDKGSQKRDIEKAREYWRLYVSRH